MLVITGASDGLGLELATLYAQDNRRVINISRRPSAAAAKNVLADLADETALRRAAAIILAEAEPLEAVIHCAGVLSVEPLNNLSQKEIERILTINLTAPMLLTSALQERLEADGTDIVTIASTAALKGYRGLMAYGASKWALRGFSANVRAELEDTDCRVLSICPGAFESRLFTKATSAKNTINQGELLQACDIARCIKQLLELPKNMEVSEIIINRRHTS